VRTRKKYGLRKRGQRIKKEKKKKKRKRKT
jgi:hypothetical protein